MQQKAVFSTRGGFRSLVSALGRVIGDERILTNCKDLSVEPLGDKWKLSWGKNTIVAEQVVTTCPAYALPKLLSFLPKDQLDDLSNLYYAPVIEIGVGMKNTGGCTLECLWRISTV